jgi:hypothetical protein
MYLLSEFLSDEKNLCYSTCLDETNLARALYPQGVQLDSPVAFFQFELERRIRLQTHSPRHACSPLMASHARDSHTSASGAGSSSAASTARRSKKGASSARNPTPVDPNAARENVKESVPANIIDVDAVVENILSTLDVCSIRIVLFEYARFRFTHRHLKFTCIFLAWLTGGDTASVCRGRNYSSLRSHASSRFPCSHYHSLHVICSSVCIFERMALPESSACARSNFQRMF